MRVQVQGAGVLAAVRPCANEVGEPKPEAWAGKLAAVRGQAHRAEGPAAVRPCASEASEPKTGAGPGTLAAMAGRTSNGVGR